MFVVLIYPASLENILFTVNPSKHNAYLLKSKMFVFLSYPASLENIPFTVNPSKHDTYITHKEHKVWYVGQSNISSVNNMTAYNE